MFLSSPSLSYPKIPMASPEVAPLSAGDAGGVAGRGGDSSSFSLERSGRDVRRGGDTTDYWRSLLLVGLVTPLTCSSAL